MENPIKMDDLGVPLFLEAPKSRWWFQKNNTLPKSHGTNTVRSTGPVVSNVFYFHPLFVEDFQFD